ncbi:hypothetical protein CVT24_009352 [Panaeolus cyanescens]|uniref:F-box domain-containing protein n=1 Tax=Panaeolus cyanescens TaxID=181874 RepID=A0A409Y7U6_9AGAR|nr:hypothetical protein CVT24_009352 [Panaeolus cyanescens]
MTTFTDLAPELVQLIGHWLISRDLRSLRLTCQVLSHDLLPLVFQSITLNTKQLDKDIVERLSFLASAPESILRLIRHVELGSLSPVRLPPLDQVHKRITLPDPLYIEHNLRKYLPIVLGSLQSTRSLKWIAHLTDQAWSQAIIVDSIGKLKNLSTLQMSLTFCVVSLPRDLLQHATSVSVTIGRQSHIPVGDLVEEFANCIARAPHITNLEFDRLVPVSDSIVSLDTLLTGSTEPMNLRRLALNYCLVRLEPQVQHLRQLSSLKLTHLPHTRSGSQIIDANSSYAEIWATLERNQIALQEISVDKVVPEFVTYLAGYSGLTSLEVKLPRDAGTVSNDEELASQFYTALHRHSKSLKRLAVYPVDSGPWCYHSVSELRQLIVKCNNLKSLLVVFVTDHDALSETKTTVFILSRPTTKKKDVSIRCYSDQWLDV